MSIDLQHCSNAAQANTLSDITPQHLQDVILEPAGPDSMKECEPGSQRCSNRGNDSNQSDTSISTASPRDVVPMAD